MLRTYSDLNILLIHWKTLLWSSFVLLIVLWIFQTYRAWSRLRHINGPLIASLSNLWLVRCTTNGALHLDLFDVCEKYGSLARIGPNTLVTKDPDLLRRMTMVRTTYKRSDWYHALKLDPERHNILSETDDVKHTELRTKMAAGYSGKENEDLEKSIDRNVLKLVDLIRTKYVSTSNDYRPFDFGRKAQYFTLDVISTVAFGKTFGFLEKDSDMHEYIETAENNLPSMVIICVLPWIGRLLESRPFRILWPSAKDQIGLGKIIAIAKEVVAERFGPNKIVKRDMLGSFLRHGLSRIEAESGSLVQIVAGSDTTATGIRATFLHIVTNPHVLSKLLHELDNATISSPIQDAEARKLPYLQAVIKEGLRIFPPLTGLMAKIVPPGGDTFNGMFIPEGTKVGYCAWGLFREKSIWGADSDLFYPERWLEGSPDKIRKQEATLELVFGNGRWQCLGKNIAWLELNKIFAELFRNFDFTLVNPVNPWHSVNLGLFTQSQMWLRASERVLS